MCISAATVSADLTLVQRRIYQTLVVTKHLQFSQPLPWTDQPLYSWLVTAIKGMRFRSDISNSYCCDPKDTINVRVASNIAFVTTDRWVNPQSGVGLMNTLVLFVHEARHNQGYGHTCAMIQNGTPIPNTNDRTIAEMGAWGVQYYLDTWLANYSDPGFINDPLLSSAGSSRGAKITHERFCDEPK